MTITTTVASATTDATSAIQKAIDLARKEGDAALAAANARTLALATFVSEVTPVTAIQPGDRVILVAEHADRYGVVTSPSGRAPIGSTGTVANGTSATGREGLVDWDEAPDASRYTAPSVVRVLKPAPQPFRSTKFKEGDKVQLGAGGAIRTVEKAYRVGEGSGYDFRLSNGTGYYASELRAAVILPKGTEVTVSADAKTTDGSGVYFGNKEIVGTVSAEPNSDGDYRISRKSDGVVQFVGAEFVTKRPPIAAGDVVEVIRPSTTLLVVGRRHVVKSVSGRYVNLQGDGYITESDGHGWAIDRFKRVTN